MLTIEKHLLIYQDPNCYAAFPGVASWEDGEVVVAFRRAPNYHGWPGIGEGETFHGDITSQLWCVSSSDRGESWGQPRLLHAPFGGASQDANLFRDGDRLWANSFVWRFVPEATARALAGTNAAQYLHPYLTRMVPGGTYVTTSGDRGRSWSAPVYPEPVPGTAPILPGIPLRLHNRGNLVRLDDGRMLLAGQLLGFLPEFHSSVGVYESRDDGKSWTYLCTAADALGTGVFEEPFLAVTPQGRWVVLTRTHRDADGARWDRAMLYRTVSDDGGRSWSRPENLGFHGEPPTAQRLDDGRWLVAYGYRLPDGPGVRARICDAEFSDLAAAPEQIIRADAGRSDTGYPAIAPLGGGRYLVVYYLNPVSYHGAGAIAGTIVHITGAPQ